MRRALLAGLTAAVLAATAPAARAADQDAVDKAVERGVAFLRAAPPLGSNDVTQPRGATALAGLTLLECGVAPDDKAVQAAATAVRQASPTMNQTYSLALGLLFLDRLGDPADVPLIESMAVRLLAGQNAAGAWSYQCPPIPDSEVRRLTSHLGQQTELVGRRQPPKEGPKDKDGKPVRRTVKDLPKEIQQQLILNSQQPPAGAAAGDNSNTQFATVALWVARRHGLPVDRALGAINLHYRGAQNADGGWSYVSGNGGIDIMYKGSSSATMTCAGLLGLAVAQGVVADADRDNGKAGPDLGKDRALKAALTLLGTAVGDAGDKPTTVSGKSFYYFWSLERVAVALDLDTIGGKDWYGWGSDVLIANQGADGAWRGEYPAQVDSCFALLFLKRANLTADLSAGLKGKMKDPGAVTLKSGGVGGDALKGAALSGIESKDKPTHDGGGAAGLPAKAPGEGHAPAAEETEGARMARELAQAPAGRRDQLLEQYRDGKGGTYTEALAGAIPRLEGDARRQAREALADRLTRMKPETLAHYFGDRDAEIRRAAALAAAQRAAKTLIPDLIPLLDDAEPSVARAAHAALKDLAGEDVGSSAAEWKAWWAKQPRP